MYDNFLFSIIFIILLEIVLELFVIRYYRHYCNPDPVSVFKKDLLVSLGFRILVVNNIV